MGECVAQTSFCPKLHIKLSFIRMRIIIIIDQTHSLIFKFNSHEIQLITPKIIIASMNSIHLNLDRMDHYHKYYWIVCHKSNLPIALAARVRAARKFITDSQNWIVKHANLMIKYYLTSHLISRLVNFKIDPNVKYQKYYISTSIDLLAKNFEFIYEPINDNISCHSNCMRFNWDILWK